METLNKIRARSLAQNLDDDTFLKIASTLILLPMYGIMILASLAQIVGGAS